MAALPTRLTDSPPRPAWAGITTADGLMEEVMNSAPFSDVEIYIVDASLALPSAREVWRGMVGNPVTRTLIDQCDLDELHVVERAVVDTLEQRAGGPDKPVLFNASCHTLIARREG